MNRRTLSGLLGAVAVAPPRFALAAAGTPATLYKTPGCECCDGYASALRRQAGLAVTVVWNEDLAAVKARAGVPARLEGCHTTTVEGYFVEGHVPIAAVKQLLAEHPAGVRGIALPGMPIGTPGMEGPKIEKFVTYAVREDGGTPVFHVE
jgi:hypothetical protein